MNLPIEDCNNMLCCAAPEPNGRAASLGHTVKEILDRWERLERRSLGVSIIKAKSGDNFFRLIPGTGLVIDVGEDRVRSASPDETAVLETGLFSGQIPIIAIHHLTQKHLILHQATGICLGKV